jgi:hypothetical protein
MNKRQRNKTSASSHTKLLAKVLRDIKKRLYFLMHGYAVTFIAFRLTMPPKKVEAILNGETDLTLEQLSDLALAVGCRLEPKLHKAKREVRRGR